MKPKVAAKDKREFIAFILPMAIQEIVKANLHRPTGRAGVMQSKSGAIFTMFEGRDGRGEEEEQCRKGRPRKESAEAQ